MSEISKPSGTDSAGRHRRWVRLCHWTIALSFLVLSVTGYLILMVHPRLYWGEVGNDLVPALVELPISANHRPEGWQQTAQFEMSGSNVVSARRTYAIFNQNGWGRSLHFLAAWFLVIGGAVYVALGAGSGHLIRDLLPKGESLSPQALREDVRRHVKREFESEVGPPYGPLQRISYAVVAFVLLPFMVVTGLTMSPAVTAAWPVLLDLLGGYQSARTLHFFGFALLIGFLIVHVVMTVLTGFRAQLRAMTIGG